MFHVPEKYRIKTGRLGSSESFGNNGYFQIPTKPGASPLAVIASDGGYWEHVSVSYPHKTPSWDDMCFIKQLFWDADDVVIQFHPAEKDYVNHHKYCLHLWRPIGVAIPTPPPIFVGPGKVAY